MIEEAKNVDAQRWIVAHYTESRSALERCLERKDPRRSSDASTILGFFDNDAPLDATQPPPRKLAHLAQFISRNNIQVVYITWPMAREARIIDLLEILRNPDSFYLFRS